MKKDRSNIGKEEIFYKYNNSAGVLREDDIFHTHKYIEIEPKDIRRR